MVDETTSQELGSVESLVTKWQAGNKACLFIHTPKLFLLTRCPQNDKTFARPGSEPFQNTPGKQFHFIARLMPLLLKYGGKHNFNGG